MATTIYFTNRNAVSEGIRVYRSTGTFDATTLPDVHTTLAGDATSFTDDTADQNTVYYYMFEAYVGNESVFSSLFNTTAVGTDVGPGPVELQVGTPETGFFGETDTLDLWTGSELANAVGLTAGTAQNDNSPWLKYLHRGVIKYVAKHAYRRGISWDQLNNAGLVYGETVIENAQGDRFKVRLLTGGDADPATEAGGEWNALLYPVHVDDPQQREWGINYTDGDLWTSSSVGNGTRTWCQETDSSYTDRRVHRGYNGTFNYQTFISDRNQSYDGWRPVLELVS